MDHISYLFKIFQTSSYQDSDTGIDYTTPTDPLESPLNGGRVYINWSAVGSEERSVSSEESDDDA